MKILLIRPKPHKETIGLQSVMVCEPLELMTLAGVLMDNGHEVRILDMILEKKGLDHHIKKFMPDLVGITGYISHIGVIKDYARTIKAVSKDSLVAVGGVHATVCQEDFVDAHIDKVCTSDVEFYLYCGCKAPFDALPFRELPLEYMEKYYYLFQNKCALIKTSYGCPYQCNFCFCKEITSYRARSIDEVIRELLTIEQEEVYIVDDDFLFDAQRLERFIEEVIRHNIRKHYLVYGRADFIAKNDDLIGQLREIGLSAVIVGIEAASQEELDSYNKKSLVTDNEKAIAILQKYDIECYGTVILGIDWDKSHFDHLYAFIRKTGLIFVNLQPLTPMPGTGMLEAYEDQLIIPYEEHEKWDMAHLVIKPSQLSTRGYYLQILKLYYKITVTPRNMRYMFKRYGVTTTMKLSVGAGKITWQYLKKIMKG
jgi:radical SAM superfamily enzyme YgiQ (UPF0313 family)